MDQLDTHYLNLTVRVPMVQIKLFFSSLARTIRFLLLILMPKLIFSLICRKSGREERGRDRERKIGCLLSLTSQGQNNKNNLFCYISVLPVNETFLYLSHKKSNVHPKEMSRFIKETCMTRHELLGSWSLYSIQKSDENFQHTNHSVNLISKSTLVSAEESAVTFLGLLDFLYKF